MPHHDKLLLLCLIIFALAFNSGCSKDGQAENVDKEDRVTIPVEVAPVLADDISAFLTGTATLEAEEEAEVVAKTSEIVREILVEEGTPVQKGQILAKLENSMLAIEMEQARADLNKLENNFNRNKELFNRSLISKEEFQSVRFQYEAQTAAFEKARLTLAYTIIRAPISGVIATRYVKIGNMINTNQQLFKIVDFDPLIARLYIPEVDIDKVKIGLTAALTLDATNGTTFEGEVIRISPIVDPQTGTIKVTVAVTDKESYLKPGMFARIRILYDTHKNSLLIPKHAVLTEDGKDLVFTIQDSIATRQIVTTGYSNEHHFEIIEGLSVGDRVVVIGQNGLKDSSIVEVIQ